MPDEATTPTHYDTIYLVYHDEISLEKTKGLMEVCSQAMQFTPDEIYFQFSSGGGSVDSAITLYNFLKSLPCEIVMHNTGSIDSAANIVFMAGNRRFAVAHTSFLFHGIGYGFGDINVSKSQISEGLSVVTEAENKIAGILARHSNLTEAEVRQLFLEGESKSATFARDKGIISELKDVEIPAGAPLYTVNTSGGG
jgi:ATP-dependent Clp protease, protease subunit